MLSRAAQKCGSSRHSRRGLSSSRSSRVASSAVAETREGRRGQKARGPGRVLSNSTRLRNARADPVASRAQVVSSVKSVKSSAWLL
jgi:hypothetical protein